MEVRNRTELVQIVEDEIRIVESNEVMPRANYKVSKSRER